MYLVESHTERDHTGQEASNQHSKAEEEELPKLSCSTHFLIWSSMVRGKKILDIKYKEVMLMNNLNIK